MKKVLVHHGARIRYILERKGIAVRDFAKKIDVNREYAYRLLRQERINIKVLERAARALGLALTDMVSDELSLDKKGIEAPASADQRLLFLEESLRAKDQEIRALKRYIAVLEEKDNCPAA
mgnify:CR=1 FL=1